MLRSLFMLNLRRFGRLIVSNRNCATFKVLTLRKNLYNGVSSELDRALLEAQELVHYSMMVMSQTRNEVIDQLKLVYDNQHHPILEATEAAYDNNVDIQMRELILLLVSKITHEYISDSNEISEHIDHQEIVKKQLTLTEIIELIYKTNLLHQSIANHRVGESRLKKEDWSIHYNNKLAILFGDFYVARAWASLGRLRSIDVNLLMSQGISDFTEGQFIMQTDAQLPAKLLSPSSLLSSSKSLTQTPTSASVTKTSTASAASTTTTSLSTLTQKLTKNPIKDWEKRHFLMYASLPGHACQSISAVADLNFFLQEAAFKFGKNFSFCWQLLTEMEPFLNNNNENSSLSKSTELVIDLMSLPVLLQMQESINKPVENFFDPSLANQEKLNIVKLYSSIIGGPIIERIRELKNRYADEALNAINCFSKCDASCALINILNAIKET